MAQWKANTITKVSIKSDQSIFISPEATFYKNALIEIQNQKQLLHTTKAMDNYYSITYTIVVQLNALISCKHSDLYEYIKFLATILYFGFPLALHISDIYYQFIWFHGFRKFSYSR